MRKILLLNFILLLCLLQQAMAQNRTVTGTVTDPGTGQGLPGVTVIVKGSPTGTNTGASGSYAIQLPANLTDAVLVFRMIGMTTQEVPVNNRSVVNVGLGADAKQLSEVIVTGYTTQNRREVTGSVATVKAEEVALAPLGSFDQALQGRAPGILVQAQSGQPGAPASVLIRGRGSILGGNQPLYILDGVEISATDFSTLNQADFETFNILKDASSTSLYGSRGANGVIVITTKKGQAGTARLNYNVQYGYSTQPENRLRLMNSNEKLDYELANGNPYDWTPEEVEERRQINTDWEKVFFQTGVTKNHTLSASGGTGKTVYFLSGSVFDQTGTVKKTGLDRYTGRANIESSAGGFIFGINATLGYSEFSNTTEENTSIGSPLNAIRWTNPYEKPYEDEAQQIYAQMDSGQPNALQQLLENTNKRQQLKGVGNVYVSYDIPFLQGLSLRTSWGSDYTSNESTAYIEPNTPSGVSSVGGQGSFARGYARLFRYTGTNSANYTREFGSDHRLSVNLFNEVVHSMSRNFGFTGYGLRGPFNNESGITAGTSANGFIPAVRGGGGENALLSYFTNINYGFKERYFVTIGARRDGSSRFGADRRWANFGSVGLSWIVTEEAFMQNLTNIFNELKFKISYGSSGNQAGIENFQSRELYSRGAYNGISGLVQTQLANPLLQWERKTIFNTGIELATLNGRLRSTFEFYNSLTSDLFLDRQLSRTTGYSSLISNIGELQNRGVEISLDGDIISTGDFRWSANVSLTRNKNTVKKLLGDQQEIISGITINRVGESINSLYVVRYAGVNPANGNPQYYNSEDEITEVYDPADRVIVGSFETPFFGGFGSSINFKGFEVSALFSFVKGNKIFSNDRANVENPDYITDNLSADLLNEWRTPGQVTNIPKHDGALFETGTTRFVEDGDFMRLRNVNVSYTLPQTWTRAAKLSNVRLFIQGQNLATWTDFRGFDPEISTGILEGAQYPALRTVTFGLNVGL